MIESFGTVRLANNRWYIQCEPHVRGRLKRVFPRIPGAAAAVLELSNTPENARELEWFLQRYPMEVVPADALAAGAQLHRETEVRVNDLLASRRAVSAFSLAEPPRDYQRLAADVLEVKGGLLVADDVGLGKTITAICSFTVPENLPALVVCPTHLPQQWQRQIHRFAPSLRTHIIKKGTPYPIIRAERAGQTELLRDEMPDVLIVNYHKLKGWAETLAGVVRLVVFDECQQLRSPWSDIYQAARLVAEAAQKREGLSATPIYNYGAEFHHVVNVISPGALGTYTEFITEWCTAHGGAKARIRDGREFGAYLRREGIMLRRTRADVSRELPELTKIVHDVEADAAALDNLRGDAIALARTILQHNESYRGEKMKAAGEFDALLRQATGIAKAPYVAAFVRLLMESELRVVLFGWHRAVYEIWKEALKDFNPVFYTGEESIVEKESAIARFTNGVSRILIMSLRSGAGVDGLQGICRTAVFGELDWSPGVHEQCVGRLHRDGQGDPCFAYFLVADDGADPVMVDVLGIKREQIESVRSPDRPLVERVETGQNNIRRLAQEFLQRRSA